MVRIKTYARLRQSAQEPLDFPGGRDRTACVRADVREGRVIVHGEKEKVFSFATDGVFDVGVSQQELYDKAVAEIVEDGLQGFNGTMFAYGQTGSGKTFSITGGSTYESRGAIPRAISHIFEDPRQVACEISYVEVYNEEVYDLLDQRKKVNVLSKKGFNSNMTTTGRETVHIKNLTVEEVHSEEEALDLFFRGNMQRSIGSTALNMSSSRSHCVFTIRVRTKATIGSLNFVDLAGSERINDTDSSYSPQDLTSKHINLSLHFLEQVVMRLQNNMVHVGFRNSTMTALLRESLNGNSRTVFLVTLNTSEKHRSETLSTLRFAQRCRSLSTNVSVNETIEQKCIRLEKENRKLKSELEDAQVRLREHEKIHDVLNDLLSRIDKDAVSVISCEVGFLHGIDAQVDPLEEIIMITDNERVKSTQIPKYTITAIERSSVEEGASVFRIYGSPPRGRGASVWARKNHALGAEQSNDETLGKYLLAELQYNSDASMLESVAWIQALEHWLGPDITGESSMYTAFGSANVGESKDEEGNFVLRKAALTSKTGVSMFTSGSGLIRRAVRMFKPRAAP